MNQVIVVGSGAAGSAAAVAAAVAGAQVTMIERADTLGGTTTYSGSVAWLPANHLETEAGIDDSQEEALTYLGELALGDVDQPLVETFVKEAGPTVHWIEEHSPVRWRVLPYPDYHPERAGGKVEGRSLEVEPLSLPAELIAQLRQPPNLPMPITYGELARGEVDADEARRRLDGGIVTMGRALVGGLVRSFLDLGGAIQRGTRARRLLVEDGHVTGVVTDNGTVRGRVVLASGGFERDPALVRAFLRGPMVAPAGAPTCGGDGVRMAQAVGAALGNMSEAWWAPTLSIPDETYDGAPVHRLLLTERVRPGSLMVDGSGQRFVDEAQNYNDLGRTLHDFDASRFAWTRSPSWLVFDASYRQRYHLGPLRRDDPDPAWLYRGDGPVALATQLGLPVDTFTATVARFNEQAASGRDDDFGRGGSEYDRFLGDARAAHPTLAPLDTAPFYAVRVSAGCIGTKGGPRTDDAGRVLAALDATPIPGLFAAGNAAANPFGLTYPGAGGTIGPALVFGIRAGLAAAGDG